MDKKILHCTVCPEAFYNYSFQYALPFFSLPPVLDIITNILSLSLNLVPI